MDRENEAGSCTPLLGAEPKQRASNIYLLFLIAVALFLCYLLIKPFLTPIAFAAIFAMVVHGLDDLNRRFVGNRNLGPASY